MSRPLNFQQIQAFKTVMETGTTTRAAQILNTTQPSISRRLSELRAATGLELFDLYNGRLRPTREGRQLYESVRRHFEGLEKIETAVHVLRKSGTGVLRIGSTPTLAAGLLPGVMARFTQQNPEVYISLQTFGTPQLRDYLGQGLIDFILTTGHIEDPSMVSTRLQRASAVCVLPIDHPLAAHRALRLDHLRRHRLVLLDDNDDIMVAMRARLRARNDQEDVMVETNSSLTICALVAAGVGVGVVNPFVAKTFAGRLAVRALRPTIPVDISLVRSVALAPSMLASRFVDMLTDQVLPDPLDDDAPPPGVPSPPSSPDTPSITMPAPPGPADP